MTEVVMRVMPGLNKVSSALAMCPAGTTLQLAEGVYDEREPLVVQKEGIRVLGFPATLGLGPEGGMGGTLIRASSVDLRGEALVQVCCTSFEMSDVDVTVSTEGDIEASQGNQKAATEDSKLRRAAKIMRGGPEVVFSRCRISCARGIGIEIGQDSAPVLQNCVVSTCTCGILVHGYAAPTIIECTAERCHEACIKVTGSCSGVVSNCLFRECAEAGVVAGGKSHTTFRHTVVNDTTGCGFLLVCKTTITIEDCVVKGQHVNGIQAGDDSDPTVRRNKVNHSQGSGLVLHDRAQGLYIANEINDSKLAGVGVRDWSNPIFTSNVINNGEGSGIVLLGDAGGVYEGNTVTRNKCAGIGLKGRAHALFDNNHISHNEGYGVWLQDHARGTFQHNMVENNSMAGISVNNHASPMVQHNSIKHGKQVGLLLQHNASGTFAHNTVSGNKAANVLLMGNSRSVVANNKISGSPGGGS